MSSLKEETRTRLLQAAISEIVEHGVADLSIRRVAERCGVSPGAPYRHFESKGELILEALKYVNSSWENAQREILASENKLQREQLIDVCVAFIKFLCDNPEYQTVLMMNDRVISPQQRMEKGKLTSMTQQLIEDYCKAQAVPEDERKNRVAAARAIVYGTAFMINSGQLPYTEETLDNVRRLIAREVDYVGAQEG